jgi:hypothetical protein
MKMQIFALILTVVFILGSLILFYQKRKLKKTSERNMDIHPDELKKWRKERKENKKPFSLNVEAMGNNVEKSHELWKSLSVLVHEAKWIGKQHEKVVLASELNRLINKHKVDFDQLKALELRIENELLNDVSESSD